MPTCEEIARLLASEQLEQAGPVRRLLIRLHLLICDGCGRYARELEALGETARDALRVPLDPERLEALERTILERAAREDSGGTSGSAVAP